MSNKLPPLPVGVAPGSGYWNDWYEKLRTLINSFAAGFPFSSITNTPTTLSGYGITDGVANSRTISTTAPLTGGGDLSANRTLAITEFAGSSPGSVPTSLGGTTNFLRADGTWSEPTGGGGSSVASGARAKGNGTNQTISSLSTFTKITCLTEEYDEAGFWDDTNKVYIPTTAGRYLIVGQASIFGINDAKRMILRIGIDTSGGGALSAANAQSFDLFRGYSSVASGFVGGAGAAIVEADGVLSIGLMVWQDSVTTAVVDASTNLCNFHAIYLGPIV